MFPAGGNERVVRIVYRPQEYVVRLKDTYGWELMQKAFCRMFNLQPPVHGSYTHDGHRFRVEDDATLNRFLRAELKEYRLVITALPTLRRCVTTRRTLRKADLRPDAPRPRIRNLCRSYQKTFRADPQLAVLNEFFVDQILSGVQIDFGLFEKGLQRHSILQQVAPSFQTAFEGVELVAHRRSPYGVKKPPAEKKHFYEGSDMAD
ncbi:hypothetical protein L0F63_004479 [Massospora cicadina]|nr:hypothetical protein L0F63_004479 [Massospora cicadina]